jgi:hypothetical protein
LVGAHQTVLLDELWQTESELSTWSSTQPRPARRVFRLSSAQPHTQPSTAERVDAGIGLVLLANGGLAGVTSLLAITGVTIATDIDSAAGRCWFVSRSACLELSLRAEL